MKKAGVAFLIIMTALSSAQAEQLAVPHTVYAGSLFNTSRLPALPPPPEPEKGGTEFREPPNVRPGVPANPPVRLPPLQEMGPLRPPRTESRPGRFETPPQYKKYERFPVWNTFYQKFKRCEPDCEPRVNNLLRPGDPRCHGVGAAIDIDGMHCRREGAIRALNNPRFEKMVNCMRREQRMLTLWKNGSHVTQGHHDHAHFSIGCHSGY